MVAYSPYTIQLSVKKKQLLFVICLLLILILTMTLNIQNSQSAFRDTLIVQNLIDNRIQDGDGDNIDGQLIGEGLFKNTGEQTDNKEITLKNKNDDVREVDKTKLRNNVDEDDDDDETESDEEKSETLQEISFEDFKYPLETDIRKLIEQSKHKGFADYNPINVYSYKTIHSPGEKCLGFRVHIIFLIKSAIGNFDRRKAIRETWASRNFVGNKEIKYVFTLGTLPSNTSMQTSLDAENKKYNDIVQYNFVDAYYNNTLKTIGAINWVTKFCSRAEFVMLVDDDYFVAVDTLVWYLQNIMVMEDKEYLFMGHAAGNVRPVRSKHGEFAKWYVSVSEYPYDRYPPFVNAGAMLMTMTFAQDLQIGIQFTKRFRFDDVYLGIVLYKMKANIFFQKKFYAAKCDYEDKCFKKALATHGYDDPEEMRYAWREHEEYRISKKKMNRNIIPYSF